MLEIVGSQVIPGYLQGLVQPSLRLQLRLDTTMPCHDAKLATAWSSVLAPLPTNCGTRVACRSEDLSIAPALLLAELLMRLQVTAGLVVSSGALLAAVRPMPGQAGHLKLLVYIPGFVTQVLGQLAAYAVNYLNALLQKKVETTEPLQKMVGLLARLAPAGNNSRHFARQALTMGIPVLPLPGLVFQFGWGRYSRLFRSSISDGTSAIATAWAKDKQTSNRLLRMAGLPVPTQVSVTSLETAVQEARKIGFPVVLKPARLDQGIGVEANLRDEAELRSAYARTRQYASDLLLEQHVPGEDYRVYVVRGEMIAAQHRTPARVEGDGVSSVMELVAAANAQRLRDSGLASNFKPIQLDPEAIELLARMGLSPASVIPLGQLLTLCRSANTSRGGSAVDVTAQVHPDNIELCQQVATLLRLDIAGLDLLIPDIARSWREVGAAFCEVNAQPQMGGAQPWIFERILRRYIVGRGRVPSVLVLTDGKPENRLGGAIAKALEQAGLTTALIVDPTANLLDSCQASLMNPGLGAIVVQTDGATIARLGMPLDRFDLLVASDCSPPATERHHTLALLLPHVTGMVVLCVDDSNSSSARKLHVELTQAYGPQRILTVATAAALPGAVLRIVLDLPDGG